MISLPASSFFALCGFAIVIAFSPFLFASHLVILAKAKHPYTQSAYLLLGMISPLIVLALLFAIIFSIPALYSLSEKSVSYIAQNLNGWIDITAGILCLIGAAVYFIISLQKKPRELGDKLPDVNRTHHLYWLGASKAALNLSSVAALYLAVRLAHKHLDHLVPTFVVACGVVALSLVPYIIFILIYKLSPHDFKIVRKKFQKISSFDYRGSVCIVLAAVGTYLVITSLVR